MPRPKLHNANILAEFQNLNYGNVPEQMNPIWLPVTEGQLPTWLNGTMYRVGGGRYKLGDLDHSGGGAAFTIRHAFDGLPYLYRFQFNSKDNTVRFNSRYLAKDFEKNLLASNGRGAVWFGESKNMSTWNRLKDFASRVDHLALRPKSSTPTSLSIGITATPNYPLPSSSSSSSTRLAMVTKSDFNGLQQVDHDSLEPQKIYTYRDYDKRLDGQLVAAHHHYDYDTKESINMTMNVGGKPTIQVFSINPQGKTTILASIQRGKDKHNTPVRSFYYHSFFTTKNYVVIPVYPMYYRNYGLDLLLNGSVLGGLEWEANTPTYFHIVDRHHGKGHVTTLLAPSFFAFHIINGRDYQDEHGNILFELDCAAYNGDMIYETHAFGDIIRASDYDRYVSLCKGKRKRKNNGIRIPPGHVTTFGDYRRYTLEWKNPHRTTTNTALATFETICTNFDFPRMNSAYCFKEHRYVYGCQVQPPTRERGERYTLVKVDVQQRVTKTFELESHHGYLCSEPIFVSAKDSDDEDDGVVLSLVNVFDNRGSQYDHCYLLVLDASSFTTIAKINIGAYIAPTFHGSYVDDASLETGSFN
ncbi:carotenoid oxygenase [Halteromyces radiatus]|uniref:carotenoid oxygenase n=1 Tax=Halteromyces radiatus TaxID=101107 RepID=UPI00222119D7|nr:carotenoid oxygenase [Halteromyces radiatus]KAI8078636.1 carotenoid oxygenase [Halteromyces radiatus]